MKKKLVLFVLLSMLLSLTALAYNGNTTVYITSSGTKYHSYGCGYLAKSCYEITLEEAARDGYTRCSRCNPPVPDFEVQSTPKPERDSSSSSSSRSSTHSSTNSSDRKSAVYESLEVTAAVSEAREDHSLRNLALAFSSFALFCLIPAALVYRSKRKSDEECRNLKIELRNERENSRKQLKEAAVKAETDAKQREWNAKKEAYLDCYGNRPSIRFVSKPSGEWIGPDRLPCSSGDGQWGARFTFYITGSGKSFHKTRGCSNADTEINAYDVKYMDLAPCKRCNPQLPSMDWYEDYLKIESIRRKYGISYVHYQIEPPGLEKLRNDVT